MTERPTIAARRYEVYVRWSAYFVMWLPTGTLFGNLPWAGGLSGVWRAWWVTAVVLSLLLLAGNVMVTRRNIDAVVGRDRRPPAALLVTWLAVLAAFVVVALVLPLPAADLSAAAALGASAASVVPRLTARRVLYMNVATVALVAPLIGVGRFAPPVVGALLVTFALWSMWSIVWTLRVLLELQRSHEDRAALALANERLRISRDLHDVFGRTLATIAVKSSLASELARRDQGERAAAEMATVRRIAQEAGTEVRRVVRGELRTTWDDEISGARSLLRSAGVSCTVTGDPVPEEAAVPLAWVVREGVTNILRHSAATRVTLAAVTDDGTTHLTLANDGAATGTDPGGTGLHAMGERLRGVGGSVTARRDGDWFLLDAVVPVPQGAPA